MSPLRKGVKTPVFCFFALTPALKDRVSDLPYRAEYLILTPTFMSGCKYREKLGFIPIRPFWSGLRNYLKTIMFYILRITFILHLEISENFLDFTV